MRKLLDIMFRNKKLSILIPILLALVVYILFILFGNAEDKIRIVAITPILSAIWFFGVFLILHTLSLQGRRSEGIKYASCCVALIPCTPGTCRFCALYLAQILCLLTLESSNGENFFIFKADEESVPGSTLIEDNAENGEIIPF